MLYRQFGTILPWNANRFFQIKTTEVRDNYVPRRPYGAFFIVIMQRYGIINEKNPREIVLLRGSGCVYKKCSFCDYHLDKCSDEAENFALNSSVLSKVTGQYGDLEVINSGSVFELDEKTLDLISEICHQKNIHTIHFEAHYLFRKRIPEIRERFGDILTTTSEKTVLTRVFPKKIPQSLQNTLTRRISFLVWRDRMSRPLSATFHSDLNISREYAWISWPKILLR